MPGDQGDFRDLPVSDESVRMWAMRSVLWHKARTLGVSVENKFISA